MTKSSTPDRQILRCKFCSRSKNVRHGRTSANKQRYQCRQCGRTFVDNGAPPGMVF